MRLDHVIEASVRFPGAGPAPGALAGRLRRRLEALPGVTAAALTNRPLLGELGFTATVANGATSVAGVEGRLVSSGYFQTLHIPLFRGRVFRLSEGPEATSEVVVDRTLADALWDSSNPVGRRLNLGSAVHPMWSTVIGEVASRTDNHIGTPPAPEMFASLRAFPAAGRLTIVVRTHGNPAPAEAAVRATVRAIAPGAALTGVSTLAHAVERGQAQPAFRAGLLALFAMIGVLLTGGGIFGIFSFLVARRRREMGVRIALGASPRQIMELVWGEAGRGMAAGIGIGCLLSLAAVPLLRSGLYGVPALDPLAFLPAALFLLCVGAAACAVPALRAATVPPAVSLREG